MLCSSLDLVLIECLLSMSLLSINISRAVSNAVSIIFREVELDTGSSREGTVVDKINIHSIRVVSMYYMYKHACRYNIAVNLPSNHI